MALPVLFLSTWRRMLHWIWKDGQNRMVWPVRPVFLHIRGTSYVPALQPFSSQSSRQTLFLLNPPPQELRLPALQQALLARLLPNRPPQGAHGGQAVHLRHLRQDGRHQEQLQFASQDAHHEGARQLGGLVWPPNR